MFALLKLGRQKLCNPMIESPRRVRHSAHAWKKTCEPGLLEGIVDVLSQAVEVVSRGCLIQHV